MKQTFDTEDYVKTYEKQLQKVSLAAIVAVGLHSFTRFVGLCALTWATVVLLGGFADSLQKRHFYTVSSLLLIEAARLATVIFFGKVVMGRLSQNTLDFRYGETREEPKLFTLRNVRMIAHVEQMLLLLPSFILPSISLRSRYYQTSSSSASASIIDFSLRIFYFLILINAAIAMITVTYSLWVNAYFLSGITLSVQRYYDEVVWRAVNKGILRADDFDIFSFFFKIQGQAYARNVQPKAIKDGYRDVALFFYAHPSGVEVVYIHLDSSVCFEQQAAAFMVGFWAEWKFVTLPAALLTNLADKMGMGQTGRAAIISFASLAREAPDMVLRTRNSKGQRVKDVLIELLDPMGSHSTDCLRALVSLVESQSRRLGGVVVTTLTGGQERKVRDVMREGQRQYMRVLAAYVLMKVGKLSMESEDMETVKKAIDPWTAKNFPRNGREMLSELCEFVGVMGPRWEEQQQQQKVVEIRVRRREEEEEEEEETVSVSASEHSRSGSSKRWSSRSSSVCSSSSIRD